ncbi:MAG: putative response regulator in two-component regulatory system [Bacteriovoracaceae bacterium]|nr:putative response regulator in two-component regulatory system [Bacteriovoracaceae bacterium]
MKKSHLKILIIEDDELQRNNLTKQLTDLGHEVHYAVSRSQAREQVTRQAFDVSFIDVDLEERRAGFELIPDLKRKGIYSVILSGHREEEYVEEGYKNECDDYLTKPFKLAAIEEILQNCVGSDQKIRVRKLIAQKFLTQDPDHLKQYEILVDNLGTKVSLHISGPSGCGKSVLAKTLHEGWHGTRDKYVEFSPEGLQDSTLQSELFGHEAGSFTDGKKKRVGLLGQANGGTLFIDEIGTIGIRMQKSLLVSLANGNYSPLGSEKMLHSDFKLITATCEDLYEKMAAKEFRQDFYNRIAGLTVHFKSLRERPRDIELLLDHVQRNFGGGRGMVIRANARKALVNYDWPGNEREFFDFWESKRKSKKPIFSTEDLPEKIVKNEYEEKYSYKVLTPKQAKLVEEVGLKTFILEIEREVVEHFIKKVGKARPIRPLMRHLGVGQKKAQNLLAGLLGSSI